MRSRKHQEKDPWTKDRQGLREGESAFNQHKMSRGVVKDYSLKHQVSVEYDMNDESKRDNIFILKVDDYKVVLDWEELSRIGRFI